MRCSEDFFGELEVLRLFHDRSVVRLGAWGRKSSREHDVRTVLSKSRTEGVIGLAASAFDILKRHSIPPYPQFFELIFDYEAGRKPELKSAMEAVFKADSGLAANDVRSLLDGHIQPKELASSSLPERMRDKMDAMQDAVDAAMTSASSFSGSLDNARENLERGISVPEMKALTIRLLDET
ncbi:MAG: diguanylate cyclase, partial [Devosia sp.]